MMAGMPVQAIITPTQPVYGFSHTHLSGTGIPDYCDVLFMPTTGEPQLNSMDYRSGFKKNNESAIPGYYKTLLDKYKIGVELTATTRVGVHRYTYPSTQQANIIIDLQPRIDGQTRDEVLDSWIEVVSNHEIRGLRRSKGWADDQYVYFYAKFSKPFKTYGISVDGNVLPNTAKGQGKNVKMYIQFDNPGEVISKVGISDVSTDGALKNLGCGSAGFRLSKKYKLMQKQHGTRNFRGSRFQAAAPTQSQTNDAINQPYHNQKQPKNAFC